MPMSPYAVTKLACEHYLKVFAEHLRPRDPEPPLLQRLRAQPDARRRLRRGHPALPRRGASPAGPSPSSATASRRATSATSTTPSAPTSSPPPRRRSSPARWSTSPAAAASASTSSAREIGRVMGHEVAVDHVAPRAGDIRHSLADISAAHELLGYEPLVRWEDGLAPTLAYLRALRTEGPTAASRTLTSARVGADPRRITGGDPQSGDLAGRARRAPSVRSMTGFGVGDVALPEGRVVAEIRSVNQRFLDVRARLPRELADLSLFAEQVARERLRRGRVELLVHTEGAVLSPCALDKRASARRLPRPRRAPRRARPRRRGAALAPRASSPTSSRPPPAAELVALCAARSSSPSSAPSTPWRRCASREGDALAADLRARCRILRELLAEVARLADASREATRRRLRERVERLLAELARGRLDPARLEAEVALFADRSDVAEELTRLGSHLESVRRGEPVAPPPTAASPSAAGSTSSSRRCCARPTPSGPRRRTRRSPSGSSPSRSSSSGCASRCRTSSRGYASG